MTQIVMLVTTINADYVLLCTNNIFVQRHAIKVLLITVKYFNNLGFYITVLFNSRVQA